MHARVVTDAPLTSAMGQSDPLNSPGSHNTGASPSRLAPGAAPAARLVGAGASIGLSNAQSMVLLEAADESRAEAILEEKIRQAKVDSYCDRLQTVYYPQN